MVDSRSSPINQFPAQLLQSRLSPTPATLESSRPAPHHNNNCCPNQSYNSNNRVLPSQPTQSRGILTMSLELLMLPFNPNQVITDL